jgi:hypothetical protein
LPTAKKRDSCIVVDLVLQVVQEDEVCTHFAQAEDVSYVGCEAERVEDGQEIEEGFVGWVGCPTFDWDAVCCVGISGVRGR